MTVRGTLGLLAALALLVLYLVAVDPPSTRLPPLSEPLLAVPAVRVTTIEIVWPETRLHAVRRAGAWQAFGHAVLPAGSVDDLLAALATIRPMDTLTPSGTNAPDYGLGAAATTLTMAAGAVPLLQLQVGNRNPAWTGVYVRRNGSAEILLVGALLHWELEKLRRIATR
jgi:hypothetical protein